MREALDLVMRVAPSPTTVFIHGPSGSGKEFVARAVHLLSLRARGPFIAVNCGAIPRDLLESELFGSEKGAYTGSVRTRVGLLENAAGGTLFLDEIGDMPHDMQVKLLRVLEDRSFSRVGGGAVIKADVRIVCATHRNLNALVEEQTFREDLYYRINVFPITLLALDERKEDLPRLTQLIIERFRSQGFANCPKLSAAAIASLQLASWPGNIRQLRNVIERAGILYPGQELGAAEIERLVSPRKPVERSVEALALMEVVREMADAAPCQGPDVIIPSATSVSDRLRGSEAFNLRDHMAELEIEFIRTALADANNSVSAAARILGLQRTTLIEKMKKFSIVRDEV
jgi:sigma-54 specific flagellar transcriptional regulator A